MEKITKLSVVFSVAIIYCTLVVHGIDSILYAMDYRNPSHLQFSEGDVLACRIDSNYWSSFYGAEHVMLAISSTDVAHIHGGSKSNENGYLGQDNFISVTTSDRFSSCRIATDQYDRVMLAKGVSPKSSWSAVWAAKKDIGRRTYYHLYGCNCQHWVTHWKYGKAWSIQSNQPPNSQCELQNYFKNGPIATANAYSKNNQHSARVSAGVGEHTEGDGVQNGRMVGPNVGAHAEFGSDYTGAGFKAGLGEVRANLGNAVGATLGLNVDTNVGVGDDGFGAQVLGTGVVHSRSEGTKFCFLGSCIHIGFG